MYTTEIKPLFSLYSFDLFIYSDISAFSTLLMVFAVIFRDICLINRWFRIKLW